MKKKINKQIKIEKVPRGIQGEKSTKDMASSGKIRTSSPKGPKPGVRKDKRSLLACNIRCKCSMETTRNSVKAKLVTKVMRKLVEWKVLSVGESHVTGQW